MRELHRESFWAGVSVRHVRVRDHRLADAYGQEAPLTLGRRIVDRLGHRLRTSPAEEAGTGGARPRTESPAPFVAELPQPAHRQLATCRPDLLQADEIRSCRRDPPDK